MLSLFLIAAVRRKRRRRALFLGAILVAALSNVLDRALYGGVVDYLQAWVLPVVNIADLIIVAGVVLVVIETGEPRLQKNGPEQITPEVRGVNRRLDE